MSPDFPGPLQPSLFPAHNPEVLEHAAVPMIRANLLAPILDALSAQGHDPAPLLRDHAFPFRHPIDPYQFIPLGNYVALFEQAAVLLS